MDYRSLVGKCHRIEGLMDKRERVLVNRGIIEPEPIIGKLPRNPDDQVDHWREFDRESHEWILDVLSKDWMLRMLYKHYDAACSNLEREQIRLMEEVGKVGKVGKVSYPNDPNNTIAF